jgi:periplasmic mercuric ion binding protein
LYNFAFIKPLILKTKSSIMKKLFFIAIIAALIAGCSGKSTSTDNAQSTTTAVADKTVTLAIEGMTCTGCENTVQEAVTKIGGVKSIKASHLDSTAVVSFDESKTSIAAIGDAINEAGYVFKGEKTTAAPEQAK